MTEHDKDHELLDSGEGRKLERFGEYTLSRPCAAAVWDPSLPREAWDKADAWFDRNGGNTWSFRRKPPEFWTIMIDGLSFKLSATAFGHVGVFPEQKSMWKIIQQAVETRKAARKTECRVLNLFAYSGGATLAAAKAGASVCHLDASRGMVERARENASLNRLDAAPIRWIVDDVRKFLARECRRGSKYDGIILDPPSFGRGKSGEVFKIETDLRDILQKCASLLSDTAILVAMSCHTPAFTPLVMARLLTGTTAGRAGTIQHGELVLAGARDVIPVPSGTYAVWRARE